MNCIECTYFKKTPPDVKYDRCTKHLTATLSNWRCALGIKIDEETRLKREKEEAWTPNFGTDPGCKEGNK